MSQSPTYGYDACKEVVAQIRKKSNPTKKAIDEMTLEELLAKEKAFLAWFPTTNHPDRDLKEHIYKQYMKPRIRFLQSCEDVEANLMV